jgi:prepilin-type N-terminal cleavage/methylation domain-containing protein
MRRDTRGGITLVELLVVVAVIGVLLAILLPAVQDARAAARANSCVNNLKQIALGLHNYNAANESFPMSQTLGSEGHGNGHSVFMAILPYMEQVAVYNAYNFFLENWHAANNTSVGVPIDTYLCPDNPDTKGVPAGEVRFPESRSTFAKGHYGANWGGGRGPWGEDFAKQRGTYLGVILTVVTPENKGKVRNIRMADITDGTSFTLAMVEKRDSFGWAVGGWGGSEFDVYTSPAYEGNDPLARKVYSGSTHEEGPNAAMCDGSVRHLSPKQARQTWYSLITRAGGEVIKFGE